jgi:hypothetical protein
MNLPMAFDLLKPSRRDCRELRCRMDANVE